jgi:epoxyqueuosine reductase
LDPVELSRFIKEEALRIGFTSAGVTTPDAPSHLDIYREWIAAGRHGEMGYLASDDAVRRRASPGELLAGCRSILVLAAPYNPPRHAPDSPRVAAYAVGQDYHEVLLERMRALVHSLEEKLGTSVRHRMYTDTGPILERELAQRAGLGWIGKNTCLIDPQRGSYLLLAEMLLDLPLAPDAPFLEDRCGTCTRCLDACPTECILPDRTIDAARCISYLTIEVKGSINPDLREATGDWLFGCDVCQEVCPWNLRFAPTSGDPAFARRPFLDPPDLTRFLSLEEAEYKTELSHSPLKRAHRHGLVRNAAVVAGNLGQAEDVPALATLLDDEDSVVRAHAAWALGKIGGAGAQAALESRLTLEEDNEVASELQAALDAA